MIHITYNIPWAIAIRFKSKPGLIRMKFIVLIILNFLFSGVITFVGFLFCFPHETAAHCMDHGDLELCQNGH